MLNLCQNNHKKNSYFICHVLTFRIIYISDLKVNKLILCDQFLIDFNTGQHFFELLETLFHCIAFLWPTSLFLKCR